MILRPNTAIQKLKSYAGRGNDRHKLRTSERRRRYLEMLAAIHKPEIDLKIDGRQAFCRMVDGDTLIVVPAEEMPQPTTDFDGEVWDFLCQKAQTYHELGHHLFTDWPSLEDSRDQLDGIHKEVSHKLWNTLEDAAIERILGQRFNIKDDLYIKNSNLLSDASAGMRGVKVDLLGAVMVAAMEFKHPVGTLAKLLDDGDDEFTFKDDDMKDEFVSDILPELNSRAKEIKLENDPVERNRRIFDLYDDLVAPLVDSSMRIPSEMDPILVLLVEAENDRSEGTVFVTPAPNTDEGLDPQIEDPEEYEPPEVDIEVVETETEEDMSKASEEDDEGEKLTEEVEAYQEGIEELSKESQFSHTVRLPGSYDRDVRYHGNDDLRLEARAASKVLASELRQHLRQERRTGLVTGQRSGKIDQSRLRHYKRGDTRIFRRMDKPEEKDYTAFILLDRSGSMDIHGMDIEPVVIGTGALAYALEEVGIDVSIMSLCDDEPRVEVPLSGSVDGYSEYLFTTASDGNTPLAQALAVTRKQVEKNAGSHPFVVVITDGAADDEDAYFEELEKCHFPVVGVSVGNEEEPPDWYDDQASYFHAITYVHFDDTLDGISQMIRRIMF